MIPDYREKFRKNIVPSLIIHGEADPLIPVSHAGAAHEMIDRSLMIMLPELGHLMFSKQAEDLLAKEVLKQIY